MKAHHIAWLAPLVLAGCNVPVWGNIFVLGVTLALFCATVTLGRHVGPDPDAGRSGRSEALPD
jgi:hypothetical protein